MRARARFTPVEQVWRAPVRRPLVQHLHHHHRLSSTTLRVHVAVDARLTSATTAIHLHAARPGTAAGRLTAPSGLALVLRDRVAPAAYPGLRLVTGARTGEPAAPPGSSTAPGAAPALVHAPAALPTPVPIVHRVPGPAAAAGDPMAARRDVPPVGRSAARSPGGGPGPAPGAPSLTTADLPGVIDQVVREIDRRVVAARERRGWTS